MPILSFSPPKNASQLRCRHVWCSRLLAREGKFTLTWSVFDDVSLHAICAHPPGVDDQVSDTVLDISIDMTAAEITIREGRFSSTPHNINYFAWPDPH